MKLCKACVKDEEEAYAFVCELENMKFDPAHFHSIWLTNLQDHSISYYFLMDDNQYIGFCSLRMVTHLHHCARVAQIEEFIIKQTYQRLGYGAFMYKELTNIAQEGECCMIELSSHKKRTKSHAFYKHMGMKQNHYKFTL